MTISPLAWLFHLVRKLGWRSLTTGIDLLKPEERRKATMLSLAITISKLIDMVAIASVMPVIGLIVSPDLVETQAQISAFYNWLEKPDIVKFISGLAILSSLAILVSGLTEVLVNRSIFFYSANCEARLTNDLLGECADAPYSWYSTTNSVSLARLVHTEISIWGQKYIHSVLNIFSQCLTIAFSTVLIIMFAALKSVLVLGVVAIGMFMLTAAIRSRILFWTRRQVVSTKDAVLACSNVLTGSKEYRFCSDQLYPIERFSESYADQVDALARMKTLNSLSPKIITVLGQVCLLSVALALWLAGASNAQIVSQIALLLLITSRLIPAANLLIGSCNTMWSAIQWIEKIHSVRASIRQSRKDQVRSSGTQDAPADWQRLKLENVSFTHDKNRGQVLHDVSFEIEFGKHYGLVGPSGSGKSSMVDIIARLRMPHSGHIFVDDVDLLQMSEQSWRSQIGFVSQHPYFSDESVRNNVAYGCREDQIDEDHVWKCLSLANIDTVIKEMPDGLDSVLGEQSLRLSGGQRQRVAIARALYKNPRLLILDEATSALDTESEAAIVETIAQLRGSTTILTISHRQSTVAGCDEIFRMDNGRIFSSPAS